MVKNLCHKKTVKQLFGRYHFILFGILMLHYHFSEASTAYLNLSAEDKEILGDDKNKNYVRDSVEEFIPKYLKITDPTLRKAYFNFAESLSLQLLNRNDKKKLDKLDYQINDDRLCIYSLDPANAEKNIISLREKITESYVRIKAWQTSASTKSVNSFKLIDKKEWIKKCR